MIFGQPHVDGEDGRHAEEIRNETEGNDGVLGNPQQRLPHSWVNNVQKSM